MELKSRSTTDTPAAPASLNRTIMELKFSFHFILSRQGLQFKSYHYGIEIVVADCSEVAAEV